MRYFRVLRMISQEELGEKLGVTRQTIASWEEEKTLPDVLTAINIAKILNVKLNDLVEETEKNFTYGPPTYRFWGSVTVEKGGKIQLPKKLLEEMGVWAGEQLLIISDIERGVELLPPNILWDNMLEKYCIKAEKEIDK